MKRATLVVLLAACTVPDLDSLGKKQCDLDAGHPCVDGYVCSAGFCEVANGGPCTGSQTQACGSSKGECRMGLMTCANGMFGPCEGAVGPTDEICDGKDNDCDGFTDENLFDSRPCELTVGVCAGAHHACVSGHYEATCTAASYGADYQTVESICDEKDNDCNGQTDEGGGGACPDAGVCAGALLACTNGTPGQCMAAGYEPTETKCDGLDNDCDGLVDEGLVSSAACAKKTGVCLGKNAACVDGGFESPCTAASYGPAYEAIESRCDGLDNDCDGYTDLLPNGSPLPSGVLCERQAGVCAGATRACVDGGLELPCSAVSYGAAYAEIDAVCDGMDHDCDGVPNRSLDRLAIGGPGPQSHLTAATDGTHLLAAYEDSASGLPHIFFRHDNLSVQISDAAASSTSPAMAQLGGLSIVVWVDAPAGSMGHVLAAGVAADGSVSWTTPVNARSVFGAPRIAATATEALIVWIDGATVTLQGAIIDGQGHLSVPATVLSTPTASDGGFVEQVFSADVASLGAVYEVGWSALQTGSSYARFRSWTSTLTPLTGVAAFNTPGEIVGDVRVSASTFGWLAQGASALLHYRLADAGIVAVGTTTHTLSDLALVDGAAFWVESPGRLEGFFERGSLLDLTPDAGTPSGTAALVFGGAVLVGYEIDKGTGSALDLDYQSICFP